MLTKRSFFRRLMEHRDAYHFFLNAFAVGEIDSAGELGRVAEHIVDSRLRAKVERHYADEMKHGRLMSERLRELGREPERLPPELDYDQGLQRAGYGLAYSRLDDPRQFDDEDLIDFFVGSKVNEERAVAEMEDIVNCLESDPETHSRLVEILRDEYTHVAYATKELNRLAECGYRDRINTLLRRCRRLEAFVHRTVSVHFMERLLAMLEYPWPVRSGARVAIEAAYAWRWLFPGPDLERVAAKVPVAEIRPRTQSALPDRDGASVPASAPKREHRL